MALIEYTAFEKQPLFIAGLDKLWVQEIVTDNIAVYEPIIIKQVLGEELAGEFDPDESEWDDLEALLVEISKGYCYYWYRRNNITTTTEIGEIANSDTNLEQQSPMTKMTTAINDMAKVIDDVVELISDDTSGLYDTYDPEVISWRINDFGF